MSHRLIDLSHTVEDGMITYKGLPAPIICDYLSREASREHYTGGTEFQIGKIEMVANTGTYVDSPFHRFADGIDLAELPLQSLAELSGIVVRATEAGRAINAESFRGLDLKGKAVLVHTGWARHWRTDQYFEGHSFLTGEAAAHLVEAGASFVGIDSLNIDDTDDGSRPVHTQLLRATIPICEHMCNLEAIPDGMPFKLYAVPVKVRAFGTFPVRALAVIEAKRAAINPAEAEVQAKAYAAQLKVPYVFLANGEEIRFWEWQREAFPRSIKTFFSQGDLERRAATGHVRRDPLARQPAHPGAESVARQPRSVDHGRLQLAGQRRRHVHAARSWFHGPR